MVVELVAVMSASGLASGWISRSSQIKVTRYVIGGSEYLFDHLARSAHSLGQAYRKKTAVLHFGVRFRRGNSMDNDDDDHDDNDDNGDDEDDEEEGDDDNSDEEGSLRSSSWKLESALFSLFSRNATLTLTC